MKPLIYIAGPYSGDDVNGNVRSAVLQAERVEAAGFDVFIPHLSHLWDLISPAPYVRWLERDNAVLLRCDALFRMDGASKGADAEVVFAQQQIIPVFHTIMSLKAHFDRD